MLDSIVHIFISSRLIPPIVDCANLKGRVPSISNLKLFKVVAIFLIWSYSKFCAISVTLLIPDALIIAMLFFIYPTNKQLLNRNIFSQPNSHVNCVYYVIYCPVPKQI